MIDAIEEDDDDLFAHTPPKGPSVRELRKQAAERGDVAFFLDIIRTKPWSLFSIYEVLRHLMRAAEVRGRSDPMTYSREIFSLMIGFNSFLMMRTQIYITERVVGRGDLPSTATIADFSADVVERILPRLLEMQKGMSEILAAQAQTARLWGLTQAKAAKAERAAAPDTEVPRRARSAGTKPVRSVSPAPRANEGERDAVVPIRVRGRRRG